MDIYRELRFKYDGVGTIFKHKRLVPTVRPHFKYSKIENLP